MKHISTFSKFSVNEESSGSKKLPDFAVKKILDIMNKNAKTAINMYFAFSKNPQMFNQLQSYQNKINGSDLEHLIASFIQKDPSEISLLDRDPEFKAKIIKLADVGDFSKVGRLKNLGLI
jgi:hypothetical protein